MLWGRKETIIWPPHGPINTYGAVFLSIAAAALFIYLHFTLRSHATAAVLLALLRADCDGRDDAQSRQIPASRPGRQHGNAQPDSDGKRRHFRDYRAI